MKKLILSLVMTLCGIGAAQAYLYNGVHFRKLSEKDRIAAVACGNKQSVFAPEKSSASEPAMAFFDYMGWVGNSYSGDIVVPERMKFSENGDWYTVTEVEMGAFYNCDELTSVQLPETIVSIGEGAFSGCPKLEEVIIPDGVSSIGQNIFEGSSGLRHVHYPAGTRYVPMLAFSSAGHPDGLVITGMENVGYLALWSFQYSTIKSLPECPNLRDFDSSVFGYSSLEHIEFIEGSTPGSSIFSNCDALKSVYFPAGFSFEHSFFHGHHTVELIRVNDPVPPHSNYDIYHEVSPSCVLEVPEESVDAYRQASVWKQFPDIRPIGSTAVKVVDTDGVKIDVTGGCVSVTGAGEIQIYDLAGRLVHQGATASPSLPKGIYIVVTEGLISKISI